MYVNLAHQYLIICAVIKSAYFMVKYGQMKEILTALMIWLGANTGLDTNHDIPKVLFLSQEKKS